MRTQITLFIFLLVTSIGISQSSISFYDNGFEKVLEIAKEQKKDIFLDTYAPWCAPCKKMDKVFRNNQVAEYYNANFINVKINVDRPDGKEIATTYDIAFLPTMLIMDYNGNVKYRLDGLQSPKELLKIGDFAVNPQNYKVEENITYATEEKPISSVQKDVEIDNIKEEKILYVLGDNSSENPDFLYHEAFFRIQQMDGSSQKIAKKYLATQDDWSSEKNMKFVISFLNSTDSQLFEYYVSNKFAFEELISAKEYRKTLEILINRTLYRQIPRPSFDRVKYLFGLLYPRKFERYAYEYMLERLEEEEKYDAFVDMGEEYLEILIKQDADLLLKLGKYKCLNSPNGELKECIYRVEQSIKITSRPTVDQFFTLAQLYLKADKKKKAIECAEQAKFLAIGEEAKNEIIIFLKKIEES